ncbi:hypothetical protein QYE76_060566 [Lolium multiflorum]|uniref:F-box domain-containing protein n=1 Tax=Lolium multiflorum TaxID=4521 RepID=A0AAD8S0B8_LOLMU|nr:hypothetical protein QYE76_060566 [Lolium multiflorum]
MNSALEGDWSAVIKLALLMKPIFTAPYLIKPSPPPSPAAQPPSPRFSDAAASDDVAPEPDYTAELPEELLAAVFGLLGSGDRKRCSLVSRRWLAAEAASRLRLRLALDARAPLLPAAPGILRRFSAVSKLALKCDRRADSVGDPALVLVARRLGPGLRRLKLRSLRAVTDDGVHALASAAVNLRKLPVGSCAFGARGIEAALRSCTQLEELSVKRLRGLASSDPITVPGPRLQSLSMILDALIVRLMEYGCVNCEIDALIVHDEADREHRGHCVRLCPTRGGKWAGAGAHAELHDELQCRKRSQSAPALLYHLSFAF